MSQNFKYKLAAYLSVIIAILAIIELIYISATGDGEMGAQIANICTAIVLIYYAIVLLIAFKNRQNKIKIGTRLIWLTLTPLILIVIVVVVSKIFSD